ncbi:MAG: RT0821/Lpp0805 family surface protein [Gammaproteobacteria bacterium]
MEYMNTGQSRLAFALGMLLASSLLAGCNSSKNQDAGVLLGGAAGGVLGSTIGGGDGRVAATVVGALVGAFIGNNIGRSMDELDYHRTGQALERTPTGEQVAWHNPDSGVNYEVTPTRTYYQGSETPCRDFTTRAVIDGKQEVVQGTACRGVDGTWQMR